MKRWLETQGYALCFKLAALRRGKPFGGLEKLWAGIWYRYYCPHPILGHDNTARACNNAGCCGCLNLDRYGTPEQIAAVRDWKPS